jgi:hypothetical protein
MTEGRLGKKVYFNIEQSCAANAIAYIMEKTLGLSIGVRVYDTEKIDTLNFLKALDYRADGCHIKDLNNQLFEPFKIPLQEEFFTCKRVNDLESFLKKADRKKESILFWINPAGNNKEGKIEHHTMVLEDIIDDKVILFGTRSISDYSMKWDTITLTFEELAKMFYPFSYEFGISKIKRI